MTNIRAVPPLADSGAADGLDERELYDVLWELIDVAGAILRARRPTPPPALRLLPGGRP